MFPMHFKIIMRVCLPLLTAITLFACSKEKEATKDDPPPPSTEKGIIAFVLKKNDQTSFPPGEFTLTIGKDSVNVELPAGTDLTDLIPEISFHGVTISPAAGIHQNFSKPVKYTITAADSSKRSYIVSVKSRKMVYVGAEKNFYALDAGNGKLVWQSQGTGNFARSKPALLNELVYCGSANGNLYAFNANTGAIVWQRKLGPLVECSPAVAGNTVYIGSGDSSFYALNAVTGQEKWKFKADYRIRSSPVLSGSTVIFGGINSLYCLDTTSGGLSWKYTLGGQIFMAGAALSNGVAFVGAGDGYVYAVNAASGQLKWKCSLDIELGISNPAIYNGVVYIAPWIQGSGGKVGSVYAVNEQSGQLVRTYLDALGFGTTPNIENGTLYISATYASKAIYAVDLASGTVRWQTTTGGASSATSPAISGNTLYTSGFNGYIYALNKLTGNEIWKFAMAANEFQAGTPVVGR